MSTDKEPRGLSDFIQRLSPARVPKGAIEETVAPRGGRQPNMPGAAVKKEVSSSAPSLRSSSARGGASGAGKEEKKPTIPGFLTKTFEIFSNEEFEDLCGWGENGDTILIKKVPEFSSTVLPRYFKHSNFQSFVRQLNMYDFHKTVQDPSHGEFRHEFFRRGREDLLHKIKRKVSQPSSSTSSHNYSSRSTNSGGVSHVHTANSETYNAAAAMMTLPNQGVATAAPVCGLSMLAESSSLKSARAPATGGGGSSGSASRKHPRDGEEDTERRVAQLEDMVKALHETNQSLWAQMSLQHSQISALRSSFSRALAIIQDLLGAQNPTLADIKLEVDASLLASQASSPSSRYPHATPHISVPAPAIGASSLGVDENEGLNVLANSAEEAASFSRVSSELWRGQSLTTIPSFSRFFSHDGHEDLAAAPANGSTVAPTEAAEFGMRTESLERAAALLEAGGEGAVHGVMAGVGEAGGDWPVDQRARKRGRMSLEDAQAIACQLGALHRTSQATIHKIDSLEAQLSTLFDGGDFGLSPQPPPLPSVVDGPVEGSALIKQPSLLGGSSSGAVAGGRLLMTTPSIGPHSSAAPHVEAGREGERRPPAEERPPSAVDPPTGEQPVNPGPEPMNVDDGQGSAQSAPTGSGENATTGAGEGGAGPTSSYSSPLSRALEGAPLVRQSGSSFQRMRTYI